MSVNQDITPDELRAIRSLSDFDLVMLISEVDDHGWTVARELLPMMLMAQVQQQGGGRA